MSVTGAVIAGGYVNALGLVRALAARGVATAVITTKRFDIAHRSRWATRGGSAPDVEERPEQLVETLERRAREWEGRAVLPTNDATLAALAGAPRPAVVALPARSAARRGGARLPRQAPDARPGRGGGPGPAVAATGLPSPQRRRATCRIPWS